MGFLTDLVTELRLDLAAHPLVSGVAPPRGDRTTRLRATSPPRSTPRPARACVALIAEVKRASPSAGSIAADADPVAQAQA
jgi:hypothetical protein